MIDPLLNEVEKEAMAKIITAHQAILDLGLQVNAEELIGAVHVMQSFVVQHALHRTHPDEFAAWFKDG